jgi:peptidoglycan/LPS O-acetylase OafA/YrhL
MDAMRGGAFEWFTPFSILCGVGLAIGYALLGAAWLVLKTEGDLRDWAYRRLDWLLAVVILVLIAVFGFALATHLRVLDRWRDEPRLLVLPLAAMLAMIGLYVGVRRPRDGVPFAMATVVVIFAFLMLAVSFWPYMIPLFGYRAAGGCSASVARILVLGCGRFRPPDRADLHRPRLLDISRQGGEGCAGILGIDSSETLTTDLSQIKGSFVIARNTATPTRARPMT